MTRIEAQQYLEEVSYKDWRFVVKYLQNKVGEFDFYLQVQFLAYDSEKGFHTVQHGRKWYISEHATKSELIQTALKAVLTAEEHEAREQFKYRGKAVFGPHIDVDVLANIADLVEVRA